jgi:hypothetical protein
MVDVITWIKNNWGTIATCLFLLSEILAYIPGINSNSVFQLIVALLKKIPNPPVPPGPKTPAVI